MPHIRFRGMEKEQIKSLSREMVDELQRIIGCPREYFVLEHIDSTFFMDGEEVKPLPFIEVHWFDRGQEVRDKTAKCITAHVKAQGVRNVDVAFCNFEKNCYYENGEHF